MKCAWLLAGMLALATSCIAPSVVAHEDRALPLEGEDVVWLPATSADVPGTYVSTEITGPLAASLRKVVYLFESEGTYTGAGLIDDDPPHFEVIGGSWQMDADGLHLDGSTAATVEVTEDGSLRLSGEEGRVILRRERAL